MKNFCITILLLATTWVGAAEKPTLNIASFNIRMDTPNDGLNQWSNRKEMVKKLIQFHDFDIFGTQEGFVHQLKEITTLENYAYVGVGREDGIEAGEHSAIVYKKDRFKVLDKGDFWLSETPDVPGKGWDATCCNRLCSWAKFKDLKSKKTFYLFNVHYDHEGKVARYESSQLILRKIKEIAGNMPFFCTGDFNATPNQEPIQVLMNSGWLLDSKLVSKTKPYGTDGTYHGYKVDAAMKDRIDYIFVPQSVEILKYGVINDIQYGRFPSDHFPVMIKARL